jgi:hypothetical protein
MNTGGMFFLSGACVAGSLIDSQGPFDLGHSHI